MKFLITGARGMVAQACVRVLHQQGESCVAFARDDLDIGDAAHVEQVIGRERPDAIINCAAWTDVDGCETDKRRAYSANADGVENLARVARKVDAAFVTISTDYVFDGAKAAGFYTQRDTPHPTSIYGHSKLDGERRAAIVYARSIIARTGWVYGTGGTNFLSRVACDAAKFLDEMRARNLPVKAISDAYGTPTHADDLAVRLIELARLDLPGIYHTAGGGSGTSYFTFARRALESQGLTDAARELQAVSHHDLPRPAPRPQNSRLYCLLSERVGLAPLADWQQRLA